MAVPSTYPESWGPLLQTHRSGTAGFANYDGLSQIGSAMHPDHSTRFDEPPPPYPNNSLLVSPLSDVFTQPALLPTERHLDDGLIAASPLAPVPLRHSSLYQVLKHDSPIAPSQGTLLHSGVSSIAHALEPQELQARPAPPACTPANVPGNARGPTLGAPEPASSASVGQVTSTSSLAVVTAATTTADPGPGLTLPQIPTLPPSARAQAPVSSATSPRAAVPAQNEPVVTPPQAHTLAQSLPEVTATQDYDTLPRLRKVSPPPWPSSKQCPYTYVYESCLVVAFSSNQRRRDPPRKTNLRHRARSHHCHRARHLRQALRPRPRARVRVLSSRRSIFLWRGASAPCCVPSWHVSSAAGGRYSVAPRPATIRTTLASEFSSLYLFCFSISGALIVVRAVQAVCEAVQGV